MNSQTQLLFLAEFKLSVLLVPLVWFLSCF